MKLSELLTIERTFHRLSYGREIVHFNRKHSYMNDFNDVPFPHMKKIMIKGSQVSTQVHGSCCSWKEILKITDELIPELENPNEIYLEDIALEGNTLMITLGS